MMDTYNGSIFKEKIYLKTLVKIRDKSLFKKNVKFKFNNRL
ncbi:hypothetical protein AC7_1299 [Clostridium perfringens NCTC 8239]|nr:hypothetical protein AC7_1299 [Clostridium perfringens NCTC 8239]